VYDERNLVVATTFPVVSVEQLRNDLVDPLSYRRLTANPPDDAAVTIGIERPILHVRLDLPNSRICRRDAIQGCVSPGSRWVSRAGLARNVSGGDIAHAMGQTGRRGGSARDAMTCFGPSFNPSCLALALVLAIAVFAVAVVLGLVALAVVVTAGAAVVTSLRVRAGFGWL
jgi:hypothetical protein